MSFKIYICFYQNFLMSQIEIKALQLRDEARKRISTISYLKHWFLKSTKHIEESIDYFKRAGNLFKTAKNWSQASTAFSDAAKLSYKIKDPIEAAFNLIEAADCYRNYDISKAIEVYLKAIQIYQENGKFLTAAKNYETIAEFLKNGLNFDEAITYYEKAAITYKQEYSYLDANKCYDKIAEYAALLEDYVRAIKIFEDLACFELANYKVKYTAKRYFFKAAICILCTGAEVMPKLRTYIAIHPVFEESRMYKLMTCLRECMKDGDVKSFENVVKEFDLVAHLSEWHITLLLRAKQLVEEGYNMCY